MLSVKPLFLFWVFLQVAEQLKNFLLALNLSSRTTSSVRLILIPSLNLQPLALPLHSQFLVSVLFLFNSSFCLLTQYTVYYIAYLSHVGARDFCTFIHGVEKSQT